MNRGAALFLTAILLCVTIPVVAAPSATRCGAVWTVTEGTKTAVEVFPSVGDTRTIFGRSYERRSNFTLYSPRESHTVENSDGTTSTVVIPSSTIRALLHCPEGSLYTPLDGTARKVAQAKRGQSIGAFHSGGAQAAYNVYYDAIRAQFNREVDKHGCLGANRQLNPNDKSCKIESRSANNVIEITVTNGAGETYKQYDKCPEGKEAESYQVTYTGDNGQDVTETRERCVDE